MRRGFIACQREWANVHYFLRAIELEPLMKASTFIFIPDFPANSDAQVWEPTPGKVNEYLPPKDEVRGTQAKRKIPSCSKYL